MSDPREIWQKQQGEVTNMSIEDLHARLERLQKRAHRELISNSAIALTAIGVFLKIFVDAPQPIHRIGWGLAIVAITLVINPFIQNAVETARRRAVPSRAGWTPSIHSYRNALESLRRLPRGWMYRIGTVLLFASLIVLLIPEIQRFYRLPGAPDLKPWIPFIGLLVLWGISTIALSRRRARWLRREYEILDTLEKDNR